MKTIIVLDRFSKGNKEYFMFRQGKKITYTIQRYHKEGVIVCVLDEGVFKMIANRQFGRKYKLPKNYKLPL